MHKQIITNITKTPTRMNHRPLFLDSWIKQTELINHSPLFLDAWIKQKELLPYVRGHKFSALFLELPALTINVDLT